MRKLKQKIRRGNIYMGYFALFVYKMPNDKKNGKIIPFTVKSWVRVTQNPHTFIPHEHRRFHSISIWF
jgi:hypothetical protein